MFTVVWLVKKRADMTQEEFTRYWIDEHTPLTAATPGIRTYRCYPMVGHDGNPPAFDAIAFAQFDDEAAWRAAERSPELAGSDSRCGQFSNSGADARFLRAGTHHRLARR